MDTGIWAVWYDLPEQGKTEYMTWLHEKHIPEALTRHGYLWAAHVPNIPSEQRVRRSSSRTVPAHTSDASVPAGSSYLLLFGGIHPHIFLDPSPAELMAEMSKGDREMIGMRVGARQCVLVEVDRADGPEVDTRAPGITPGPVIQFGTFNGITLENDEEIGTWYSRSRLPLMASMEGCVGVRKMVTASGWAKHGIMYEFTSMQAVNDNFIDRDPEWTGRVITGQVHAPGSPTLGERIWPPA